MKIDVMCEIVLPFSSWTLTSEIQEQKPMLVGLTSISNVHFFQSLFISVNVKSSVKSTKNLVPDESISSNVAEIGSSSF